MLHAAVVAAALLVALLGCIGGAVLQSSRDAPVPPNLPCVSWEHSTYSQRTPNPDTLFLSAHTWVKGYGVDYCTLMGDIFPCFSADEGTQTFGHHDFHRTEIPNDFCRSWVNNSVQFSKSFYLPKKGPSWQTWKWQLTQTGNVVPDNAIRFGKRIMARNQNPPPGYCFGKGFIGWAEEDQNGRFGKVHFSIVQEAVTMSTFEVAICEAYHPTPAPTTPGPDTAAPTAAPTPTNKPFIRFGNAIPSGHYIDAVISQGNTSFAWKNYGFAQFSDWNTLFDDGTGTVEVFENVNGSRGELLLRTSITLTSGPLVVVVKDTWPPRDPWNVETIAASYVPVTSGSGVRLFNLSPDTFSAGLKGNNETLVDGIKFSVGSVWVPVPVEQFTFDAFDDANKDVTVASTTFTPPPAPFVFTNFLLGLQNTTTPTLKARLVPLIDAPEL